MPEQEFPPLRRSPRHYRPDRDEQEPPPWANLPPVRPRPRHGRPADPDADPSNLTSPDSAGPFGPAVATERDGPGADGGADLPRPPSPEPRVPGGRALRAAARRRRRWLLLGGSLAVVVGTVLAVVLLTGGGSGPASVTPNALITTFQPGELRQVPNACHAVPAATVQQYLPGAPKVASPLQVNGSAESACNWTVDKPPLYRLMQLNLNAFAPNGLASGNGSATRAAIDAYALALRNMQDPPKRSPAPKAAVQVLSGFGNEAFSAVQVYRVGGAVTDVATVTVRYRNALVTVTLNGLAHSNRGHYGPVSPSTLTAAATAFAKAAESALH